MTQNIVDFSIDPSGAQLLDDLLTDSKQNELSSNSGTARPSYALAGTSWIDTTTNPWIVNYYDGSSDVKIGEINTTTHIFTPYFGDGAVGAPSMTFNSDKDTGFYRTGSGVIDVTSNGVRVGGFDADGINAIAFKIDGKQVVNGAAFGAYSNAAHSFASTTFVKVQYNTEDYDTDAAYDPTTNYRFTAPQDGVYFFKAGIGFTTGGVTILMRLYKNGSYAQELANSVNVQGATGCAQLKLLAGDYVEVYVLQSGVTQNGGGSSTENYFSGTFLRAL